MNKVDLIVKDMLLGYPTLYRSRFDVLCHLFACNGNGFVWQDGKLVHAFRPELCEDRKKTRLAELEAEVTKSKERLRKDNKCLRDLNSARLADAQAALAYYKHVKANIDVYAKTYAGSDYRDHSHFIYVEAHRGSLGYWLIDPKQIPDIGRPSFRIEDVDTEWKEAIQGWFKEFIPTMNGYMGVWNETTKEFDGVKGYEKFVAHVYALRKFYHSLPADIELEKRQNEMAMKIVNEILAEEAAEKAKAQKRR